MKKNNLFRLLLDHIDETSLTHLQIFFLREHGKQYDDCGVVAYLYSSKQISNVLLKELVLQTNNSKLIDMYHVIELNNERRF